MNRSFARYAVGLIMLLSLAACGTPDQPTGQTGDMPAASPSASAAAPGSGTPKIAADATLLTIRTRGGMCPGGCWSEQQIKADGSYVASDYTGMQKNGTLDPAEAAKLTQLIAESDLNQIKAQPFTGTCPIAFDGLEFVYTFQTMSGPVEIASCESGIDERSPLFQQIASILATINQNQ